MNDKIVIITGANSGNGKAATSEKGFTQLKNIFSSSSYPSYATNSQNIDQIWRLSTTLTEEYTQNF